MLSYIILIALALGINAAPANHERHAHQDIHLKRLDRHRAHGHAEPASASTSASAHINPPKTIHKRGGEVRRVVYSTSMRLHSESRPEWVRKRF